MIEVGAYKALWADVHLGPEQAIIAHRLLSGKALLPVHWATFDLALHGEPIERLTQAARQAGARLLTPPPVDQWSALLVVTTT